MAIRNTRLVIKNSITSGATLPSASSILRGEPVVNLDQGILYFSGHTGSGDYVNSDNPTSGYFEVGSNIYNLKIRNQITTYSGITGSGLVDKFLRGTSTGFVLDDISNIAGIDTYVTGATWSPNTLTISRNQGQPNIPVTINTFNGLTLYGTNIVNGDITVTGTTTLNGPTYYNNTATVSNEIVNYGLLTAYTETNDTYVTGGTVSVPATSDSKSVTIGLTYKNSDGIPRIITAENTFTTGGTYSNSTKLITLTRNDSVQYTVDLSAIDVNDTYVTGGTNTPATNNTNSASIGLKYNQDIPDGTYTLPYTNTFVTGGTYNAGTINLTRNDGVIVPISGLLANDTYVTGFTYNSASNTFTVSQNNGASSYSASISSVSGLTIDNLTAGRVVYVGTGGLLTDEAGFTYNDSTNTLSTPSDGSMVVGTGGLVVGSGGSPNTPGTGSVVIHGDLTVFGNAITASTGELYVEDNRITLNYNPTTGTSITSIGSGWEIQDGSGVDGTDVYLRLAHFNDTGFSEYTSTTGVANRGLYTSLNDIVIRQATLDDTPDANAIGKRVLAEDDILDGGTY